MSRVEERKKLIWKYFWKRKRQEVGGFFKDYGVILIIIQLGVLFMLSVIFWMPPTATSVAISPFLGKLFLSLALIEIIIFFLGWVISSIIWWIKSNWKLATQDAVKELNRRSRKRKR